jgi:hypothetical protein
MNNPRIHPSQIPRFFRRIQTTRKARFTTTGKQATQPKKKTKVDVESPEEPEEAPMASAPMNISQKAAVAATALSTRLMSALMTNPDLFLEINLLFLSLSCPCFQRCGNSIRQPFGCIGFEGPKSSDGRPAHTLVRRGQKG